MRPAVLTRSTDQGARRWTKPSRPMADPGGRRQARVRAGESSPAGRSGAGSCSRVPTRWSI